MSIAGAGLSQLSDAAARALLAHTLAAASPPRRQGTIRMDSTHPPLPLIYLLLKIPARRRMSLQSSGRLGVGVLDRRSASLAMVSVRSPWTDGDRRPARRARWRLDAYGDGTAARELERLLDEWRELERTGRTTLRITAHGRGDVARSRFRWIRER